MADNIQVTAGVGTTVATDEIGGIHWPFAKLAFGPLDTATVVTAAVGLPVSVVGTATVGGTVAVSAAPPRTATSDAITSYLATDAIQAGATALTPKFAFANAAAAGDTQVVAAAAGKKIRVLRYKIGPVSAAVAVRFGSAATAIGETSNLAANGGCGGAFCPVGHFETAAGEALNLNLSAVANVGVSVTYIEVD